jgi:hypothetical protein
MKPNRAAAEKVAWLIYSHPDLTKPGDIAVGITIAWHLNDKGEAWPSNETLSKHAHVAHSFVSESIKRLKAAGILDWIDRSANKGKNKTNLYSFPVLANASNPIRLTDRKTKQSNRHVPTHETDDETIERFKREREEKHERDKQEREAKEREEAVDPAEFDQVVDGILRRARESGRLVD